MQNGNCIGSEIEIIEQPQDCKVENKELPAPTNLRSWDHIFISYWSNDRVFVDYLANTLKTNGYPVWVDNLGPEFGGLRGGEEWQRALANAIHKAAVVVFVACPESLKSEWVNAEIRRALEEKRPLIPLIIRPLDEESRGAMRSLGLDVLQQIDVTRQSKTGLNPLLVAAEHYFVLVRLYLKIMATKGDEQKAAIIRLFECIQDNDNANLYLAELLSCDERHIVRAVLELMHAYSWRSPLPGTIRDALRPLTYDLDISIANWAGQFLRRNS
jgi:TIR domain